MLPLGQIIQNYGLGNHCYADDTQIYISTQPDVTSALSTLSACLPFIVDTGLDETELPTVKLLTN